MKSFSCGGTAPFQSETEQDTAEQVARHARDGHGIAEVPGELVAQPRSSILWSS